MTLVVPAIFVALCVATPFMPPPPGVTSGSVQGLFAYVVLTALAVWMDRSRTEATCPTGATG